MYARAVWVPSELWLKERRHNRGAARPGFGVRSQGLRRGPEAGHDHHPGGVEGLGTLVVAAGEGAERCWLHFGHMGVTPRQASHGQGSSPGISESAGVAAATMQRCER